MLLANGRCSEVDHRSYQTPKASAGFPGAREELKEKDCLLFSLCVSGEAVAVP